MREFGAWVIRGGSVLVRARVRTGTLIRRRLAGEVARDLGAKPISRQERVRPLPAGARIGHPAQGRGVARKETARGDLIRGRAAVRDPVVRTSPFLECPRDRLAVDPLLAKFRLEGPLPAGAGPITRLDPLRRERLVVEHAEAGEPLDGARYEIFAVASGHQPATDLAD